MPAQSLKLQKNKQGGEVLQFNSNKSFNSNYYEPIFREEVNAYLSSIEDLQNQIQQHQYSVQTSLHLSRNLLINNELLLGNSVHTTNIIADELASGREKMGNFLFEQLSSHVSLSQQKTDAILDLYNSSGNITKCVTKLNRFCSMCSSGILNYANLAQEISISDNGQSNMSALADDISEIWERANQINSAAQGLTNGLMNISQSIFEIYNSSKQVTDRILSLSNNAAQYAGMN